MNKKPTRRHHYIPRVYLKKFSRKQKKQYKISVHDFEKDKLFETNINNICVERDFYAIETDNQEHSNLIENFYSQTFESDYNEVYKILTNPNKSTITNEERAKITTTIISFIYRSPIWIEKHNDLCDRIIDNTFLTFEHPDNKKKRIIKFKGGGEINCEGRTKKQVKEEVRKNNHQRYVIEHIKYTLKLARSRINDGIQVIKLSDDDKEFLTSDNPVTMHNFQTSHIMPFHPENIISLPIDSKHIVKIMPQSLESLPNWISRMETNGHIAYTLRMTNNLQQYENSNKYLLGKKNVINTFFENKPKYERTSSEEENRRIDSINEEINQKLELLGMEQFKIKRKRP